jgi:endonuclease/exonuclease/phosphatase family metal-dependent hydrolase
MAGDFNAKQLEWNSLLVKDSGTLLHDYVDSNACLIYGPESPTIVPYQLNNKLEVLDIVFAKDFVLAVYLTACPAHSSDHLPVVIDITFRKSFQHLLYCLYFMRVHWEA